MKHIILCADDYGKNLSLSQAIIDLLEKRRLSATSCMTNFPDWQAMASLLQPLQGQVQVGLHFNLTEGELLSGALQSMPLSVCMLKASLRQLDQPAIQLELNAQLDAFIEGLGRLPDFIDGHQHIHQFPVIRDALLAVYQQRFPHKDSFLRSVTDCKPYRAKLKGAVIQWMGGSAFKQQLIANKIPHNPNFSGIYHFKYARQYATIFSYFLQTIGEGGLIMCHPGRLSADTVSDPILAARFYEYQYFSSEQFLDDCAAQQITLSPEKKLC